MAACPASKTNWNVIYCMTELQEPCHFLHLWMGNMLGLLFCLLLVLAPPTIRCPVPCLNIHHWEASFIYSMDAKCVFKCFGSTTKEREWRRIFGGLEENPRNFAFSFKPLQAQLLGIFFWPCKYWHSWCLGFQYYFSPDLIFVCHLLLFS